MHDDLAIGAGGFPYYHINVRFVSVFLVSNDDGTSIIWSKKCSMLCKIEKRAGRKEAGSLGVEFQDFGISHNNIVKEIEVSRYLLSVRMKVKSSFTIMSAYLNSPSFKLTNSLSRR